jgi:hypothetical protein
MKSARFIVTLSSLMLVLAVFMRSYRRLRPVPAPPAAEAIGWRVGLPVVEFQ